jgi:hypothetical protein
MLGEMTISTSTFAEPAVNGTAGLYRFVHSLTKDGEETGDIANSCRNLKGIIELTRIFSVR